MGLVLEFKMWISFIGERLDYFFKKAFGISTSIDPVILARSNLIVLAYAGRLTKLSESIRIFTGIKHHGELESRIGNKVNKPWILNRGIRKLIDYKELREYERVFRSVSSFVHDFEIAMLTLMDSLFMGSTEHAELSIALRRLVLKKIAESCVLETRKHPYDIYQQFLFINLIKKISSRFLNLHVLANILQQKI